MEEGGGGDGELTESDDTSSSSSSSSWSSSSTGSGDAAFILDFDAFLTTAGAALLADVLAGGRHVRTRRKALMLNELVASREWGDGHAPPDRPQY